MDTKIDDLCVLKIKRKIMNYQNIKFEKLLIDYPFLVSFLEENNIEFKTNNEKSLSELLYLINEEDTEEQAIDKVGIIENMNSFINQMKSFLGENNNEVQKLSIFPGNDKSGNPETFERLDIEPGEIICIVGPTGSGKSRLLGDIEWVAQGDTPTKRTILINDEKPDPKWRFSTSSKLVAQLSQNMNFVMDLTVYEFIELHAKSRLTPDASKIIAKIIDKANNLAGEQFSSNTPITSLSGGQSRALMIADTAILSKSPIVLIDEIENAGIDRQRAINLLVGEDKIVLMSTHDPILALMGNKRIVIKNGGIHKVINTSEKEKAFLSELKKMDDIVQKMRSRLRMGDILTEM